MTMLWKKRRFSQWQVAEFSITETLDERGTYRLDGGNKPPEFFDTLERAKIQASTLSALSQVTAENARLRAELALLQNGGTWERHPLPEDFEPLAEAAGTGPDGRGTPLTPGRVTVPLASADVAGISSRLAAVLERNGQQPRILAMAGPGTESF